MNLNLTRHPFSSGLLCASLLTVAACATLPEPKFEKHYFPKDQAYIGVPADLRPYEKLGLVRSKVDFPTLSPEHDDAELCKTYFNKSVEELVTFAKKKGGDAVIDVRSVTFLIDGRSETHPTPQCVDDGESGQVLTQGIAIKYKEPEDVDSNSAKAPPRKKKRSSTPSE